VPFRRQLYSPEVVSMMYRVLDECMAEIVDDQTLDPVMLAGINTRCAQIILGAVAQGEQNPEALKQIVLELIGSSPSIF
jgi:hypothetical protein